MDFKIPPEFIFSELTLFVCTYVAKLGNINISLDSLTNLLCSSLKGNVVAVHSNFGYATQNGYENFIKKPKNKSVTKSMYIKGKTRKIQGNGTCFNSAVEPIIKLETPNINKFYFIKCFPTTGETQIPGVIMNDFSDGHSVLMIFVDYLNSLNVGTDGKLIYIIYEEPKMLNYKFILNKQSDRLLINLFKISEYLEILESNEINSNIFTIIIPPFPIREIKSPVDDIKVSFKMQTSIKRAPRINIFPSGKVNILGAETTSSAKDIYKFLTEIFNSNWSLFINVKPLPDY